MRSTSEQEWYVVAAVFTLHVLAAIAFFAIWAALAVAIFLGIGYVVAML